MKALWIVAVLSLGGCSSSPTAPSAVVPPAVVTPPSNGTPSPIADGAFRGQIHADMRAELTYRRDGRSSFSVVIPSTNHLCMEAGTPPVTAAIVFTAQPGTLGCYVRDRVNNNEDYLRVCFVSADRVEGNFWMHAHTFGSQQPRCINGPDPTPTATSQFARPEGGSFNFTLTRQ